MCLVTDGRSAWQQFSDFARDAARWIRDHQAEIEAFGIWGAVGNAGRRARLYVPFQPEAWQEIAQVSRSDEEPVDPASLILGLYGPGGTGFPALRAELESASLLAERQSEVGEVLDSLVDGRPFVAICGALPLVEHVLGKAAGRWKQPLDQLKVLEQRLDEPLDEQDELDLLLEATALEMVLSELPDIWKPQRQSVGSISDKLNRHTALHGTARGWEDPANATRAVLLVAAVAKVAGPLLGPRK